MTNLEILKSVTVELDRFKKKLALAIKEQEETEYGSNRAFAACKRSALDLKNELTKITQSQKFR